MREAAMKQDNTPRDYSKLNLQFRGKQAILIGFRTKGEKSCFSRIVANVQLNWQEICLTHQI